MFMKQSFTEPSHLKVDFLKTRFTKSNGWQTFPLRRNELRGITQTKKNGIIKCLADVSANNKYFWEKILSNEESVDLAQTRESGEIYIH